MRILFLGSSEFALPTLFSILNDGHDIVTVVTQPDRAQGRGRHLAPTPVKAEALRIGLPVMAVDQVNEPQVVSTIKSLRADLAYVAAFGQKIGPELLAAFPVGIINLHPSLLPALRGAAPVQWAILNGDTETGVSVFRLVEKMDAGPVLVQRRTAIVPGETADELLARLARVGCDAVRAALEALVANPAMPGTPQDPALVTFGRKLRKEDGRITFDQTAARVAHRVCGLWSWPGAACRYVSADGRRDEVVLLARAVPYEGLAVPARTPEDCGLITEMLAVQCLDRELSLLEVKPAGGRLMPWPDFVNGRHVRPGDRLLPADISP